MPAIHGVLAGAYPTTTVLVQLHSDTYSDVAVGATSTAFFTLGNNGEARDQDGVVHENWLLVGSAASFEARATVTSGSLTSGTTGSWLNLGTTRTWTRNDTTFDAVPTECVMTVEIRHATTLVVHATATITLSASKEGA